MPFNTSDPGDLAVADMMVTFWTNFVKTGDPTPPPPPLPPPRMTVVMGTRNHQLDVFPQDQLPVDDAPLMVSELDIVHPQGLPCDTCRYYNFSWPFVDIMDKVGTLLNIDTDPEYIHSRSAAETLWMKTIPHLQK